MSGWLNVIKTNSRLSSIVLWSSIFLIQLLFALLHASSKGNWPIDSTGISYIQPSGMELEFGDSYAYNTLAYNLLTFGEYLNPAGMNSAWVTPGYPLFLSLVYMIFGYGYLPVILIQVLLHSFTIFMFFKTVRRKVNVVAAWVIVALLMVNLRMSVYAGLIYTETLFLFIISLLFYLIHFRPLARIKWLEVVLIAILSGFGFLIRPVLIPFIFVLGLIILFDKYYTKRDLVVFGVVLALLPALWLWRNFQHFDRLVISTNPEITMSTSIYLEPSKFDFWSSYSMVEFAKQHQNPVLEESRLWLKKRGQEVGITDVQHYPQGYAYEPLSGEFAAKFNTWRKEHPFLYVMRTAYMFKVLLSPFIDDMSFKNKIFSFLAWFLTFPFAFLGVFQTRTRRTPIYWFGLISGVLLLLVPAAVLVDSNLRYQLPGQLMFTLSAAITIQSLLHNRRLNFLNL